MPVYPDKSGYTPPGLVRRQPVEPPSQPRNPRANSMRTVTRFLALLTRPSARARVVSTTCRRRRRKSRKPSVEGKRHKRYFKRRPRGYHSRKSRRCGY